MTIFISPKLDCRQWWWGGGGGILICFMLFLSLWLNIFTFSSLLCSPLSGLLSTIHYSCSTLSFYVWSDPLAHIQYVFSDLIHAYLLTLIWYNSILYDPIQYNILAYLWYTNSFLIWYFLLWYLQPKPIQPNLFSRSSLFWSIRSYTRNFSFFFK